VGSGNGYVELSVVAGLDLDSHADSAALTLPHHNGRTKGVNTNTESN
jgi:hypothetical protein